MTQQKNNDERKVVIELDHVKRNFLVGEEVVHALRGVSFKIYESSEARRVGKDCRPTCRYRGWPLI